MGTEPHGVDPVCRGHQSHCLPEGTSSPSSPLRRILFTPWKKWCTGTGCSLLPSPFPPAPQKQLLPVVSYRAPKSPQMRGAASLRAWIFPAGPRLGCSWFRCAESCRCDLFICLPPPSRPSPRCLPLAFHPHASPPTSSHPAHRGGETPRPTPASPRRRVGIAGAGVCVCVCVCAEGRGG